MNVLIEILWYLFLIGVIYLFGLPFIIIGIYICLRIIVLVISFIVLICLYVWDKIKELFRRMNWRIGKN